MSSVPQYSDAGLKVLRSFGNSSDTKGATSLVRRNSNQPNRLSSWHAYVGFKDPTPHIFNSKFYRISAAPREGIDRKIARNFQYVDDRADLGKRVMADPHAAKVRDLISDFAGSSLPSPYLDLEEVARSVLSAINSHTDRVDIEEWATKLAEDVSEAGD